MALCLGLVGRNLGVPAGYYEFQSPFFRELRLTVISLTKSVRFIIFVLKRIRTSAAQPFYFHEFMAFIGLGVMLFVLSYAIDLYCLYQINPAAFKGVPPSPNQLEDLLAVGYFSVTNFTAAGLGDIVPNTISARLFVASELIISFYFTIFIIANLALIRESFVQKRQN